MEEKIEFYGYTPEKMALATDFIKDGVNNKSIDSIVETFNKLFDRNDKPGKCSSCSAKRFRMLIVNFVKQGRIIWDRYNLYDKVISIENVATDEDIDSLFEQKEQTEETTTEDKVISTPDVATTEDIDSLFEQKEEQTEPVKQTKQTKESKKNKTNEKSK